ncbi:symporter [Megasphaera cerevisiae DSM 20462]|uniref:Symporter n=1 Tax=Megasphaera cerevisiae DSM 20462 TaxID=1122219 RepID=A0A0J6WX54_9FIRM|nr:sodium:solute symporter family protein [Megasphaera cerevisiae]KMO86813.1 symporter [Megasphaera cerevisiae DSM 20462]SJZ35818.1 solute:Na+ symporter, SSS family [Megasphaera cerevisiae DSM 20462]
MSIQLGIVILYVCILVGISMYVRKRTLNSVGFLFAGRGLTTPMVAANITATAVGAASTIGVAENAFTHGISAGLYNVAWAAGTIVMAFLAAGKYRKMECTTIPEFFERFYDKKGRIIAVLGMITVQLVITSLQYIAGGAILSSLLPQFFTFEQGMIVSAIVFIGTTLIGGLWFSGISNILSVTLIYIGVCISTFTIIQKQGGWDQLVLSLPAGVAWFDPIAPLGLATVIGWFVVMITQTLTAQGPVQIACAAADEKTAKRGFLWGAVMMFPIGFLCAIMGMAARVAHPALNATLALPNMIMGLEPIVAGVTLAALWAADIGTCSHILLAAGTLFSQDIYKRFINPRITDHQYTIINRWAVLLLGLGTLWMAFNASGIVKTMLIGLSLTTAFTIVFLGTIFLPGLCRKNTAFYTTAAGIITLICWQFIPATHVVAHPIYLEWIVCSITFVLVALIDSQRIKHAS